VGGVRRRDLQDALKSLLKMGYGIRKSEVDGLLRHRHPTAYPVYELNFRSHLIRRSKAPRRAQLLTLETTACSQQQHG